jgi:Uma2 family endonuclease
MTSNPITLRDLKVDDRDDYGKVVAENVTFEQYMARYAEHFCEWVDGVVIEMSPIHIVHDRLMDYLRNLLKTYFALRPVGTVIGAPFVMKLDPVRSGREPDLQVILNVHRDRLEPTMVVGAADIVIEVVSTESEPRDYGKKFQEYEQGGVPEYWIFDPLRETTHFHRLNDKGVYVPHQPDGDGNYTTPLLPDFQLNVTGLWDEELPDIIQIVEMMKAMLADGSER